MIKRNFDTFKRYVFLFLALISLYVALMTFVYIIPNSLVSNQVEAGRELIQSEGKRPILQFGGTRAAQLDNFTDNVMLEGVIKNENENPLEASMNVRSYPRYWHGYQIVLRPLLTVMSYAGIRYFNIFVILILLCLVFSNIMKNLGVLYSIAFLISQAMIYVTIIPMSLQFTTSFLMMSFAMLAVGYLHEKKRKKCLGYLFLSIGSLINFVDFLTYPLVTLGIPLIYVILLENKNKKISFFANFFLVIKNSILWGLGYGFTWITKWFLSSIVLNTNVLKQAAQQATFRTAGSPEYQTSPKSALAVNLETMFPSFAIKAFLCFFVIWMIIFIFYRKPLMSVLKMTPLIFISIFPLIWFVALANHSEMHFWFTYRVLSISVFGVLCFMISIIDKEKIKRLCNKRIV